VLVLIGDSSCAGAVGVAAVTAAVFRCAARSSASRMRVQIVAASASSPFL